jgi:16S rRNA (cytosine1402-N4)-methyltransferase
MDEDAAANAIEDERFTFIRSNFKYLKNFLHYYGVEQVDGILADLGVSFHHFDTAERGFSFRYESPLDMRMNRQANLTAVKVLNTYSEERMADVFYYYGELRNARKIAQTIVKARKNSEIRTTAEFVEILKPFAGRDREKKELSCAFQALRIEVNGELDALKTMLLQTLDVLKQSGRLVILTYHSLEDRLVKNFIRSGNFEGKIEKDFFGNVKSPILPVSNKAIVPSESEITQNPRARSAKLRMGFKK